jgi:hypothetical protein
MPLLTGPQREKLISLLIDAFPRREAMEKVLFLGEFKSLDSYGKTGSYTDDLVRLLESAESSGSTRRSCGRLVEQQHRFSGGLPPSEPLKH